MVIPLSLLPSFSRPSLEPLTRACRRTYRLHHKASSANAPLEFCDNCHALADSLRRAETELTATHNRSNVATRQLTLGRRSQVVARSVSCHGCWFLEKTLRNRLESVNLDVRGQYAHDYAFRARVPGAWTSLDIFFGPDDGGGHSHAQEGLPFYFQLHGAAGWGGRRCRVPGISCDTKLLRQWLETCEREHGGHCSRVAGDWLLPMVKTVSFIDVQKQCVVTLDKMPVSYFILSYAWGDRPTLVRTKDNADAMARPGALAGAFDVPPTTRDAMLVTHQLGERYLWVDALCIVQDFPYLDKKPLLDAMGALYAHARLTIVAADGTSVFTGLSGVSRTADRANKIFCLPNATLVDTDTPEYSYFHLDKFHWSTRAWTLQEHLFSRRMLVFERFLSWRCAANTWFEVHDDPLTERTDSPKMFNAGWPSLDSYGNLVELFNTRNIRNGREMPDAFGGALMALGEAFPGGFHFGLPEFYFDIALLWQPHRPRGPRGDSDDDRERLPSWSWFSILGTVRLSLWYQATDYLDEHASSPFPVTISPLVTWRKEVNGKLLSIDNSYHHVRDDHFSKACREPAVPDEWTRHVDEADGHVYYTNSHIGPDMRFRYPIPRFTPPRDISSLQGPQQPSPQIRCTAERALVTLSAAKDRPEEPRPYEKYYRDILHPATGKWVGEVVAQEHRAELTGELHGCEMVAVSRGTTPLHGPNHQAHPFAELRDPQGYIRGNAPLVGSMYRFVNVFWVYWKDGVAYRKGLGRVWEPRWFLDLPREQVELVLG